MKLQYLLSTNVSGLTTLFDIGSDPDHLASLSLDVDLINPTVSKKLEFDEIDLISLRLLCGYYALINNEYYKIDAIMSDGNLLSYSDEDDIIISLSDVDSFWG